MDTARKALRTGPKARLTARITLRTGLRALRVGREALRGGRGALRVGCEALRVGREALRWGRKALRRGRTTRPRGHEALRPACKARRKTRKALSPGRAVLRGDAHPVGGLSLPRHRRGRWPRAAEVEGGVVLVFRGGRLLLPLPGFGERVGVRGLTDPDERRTIAIVATLQTMTTDFDFTRINAVGGSVERAFESLCKSLAKRFPPDGYHADWAFTPNGNPDGGVECFWSQSDGSMTGYQAKYFPNYMDASRWKEIKGSFRTALAAYPRLIEYIVCLPQDLPHSPKPGTATARHKWEALQSELEQIAASSARTVKVSLWDAHSLSEMLVSDKAAGLISFYFGSDEFRIPRLRQLLAEQAAKVGDRYQPAIHVSTSVESAYSIMGWSPLHRDKLSRQLLDAVRSLNSSTFTEAMSDLADAKSASRLTADGFLAAVACLSNSLGSRYNEIVGHIRSSVEDLFEALAPVTHAAHDRHTEQVARNRAWLKWRALEPILNDLSACLQALEGHIDLDAVSLVDRRIALVVGEGGSGKTHTMVTAAHSAISNECPAILLLGHELNAQDIWDRACRLAGVPSKDSLLAGLNAAGELADCRALLLIDAINEANNSHAWASMLPAIEAAIKPYPHLAVVVSLRDAYLHWPPIQDAVSALPWIVQTGFTGDPHAAMATYFNYYNIALPDVPSLHPEFYNPLFLSLFCRVVAGDAASPLPGHPIPYDPSVASFPVLFQQFIAQIERSLAKSVDLDFDAGPPLQTAVEDIAELMATEHTSSIDVPACKAILSKRLGPSMGSNAVLLLQSAGLLLKSPHYEPETQTSSQRIEFAYERLGNHLVAARLLSRYSTPQAAVELVEDGGALAKAAVDEYGAMRGPGLIRAAFLEWEAAFGVSLFDTVPALREMNAWQLAYLDSLPFSSSVRDSVDRFLPICLDNLSGNARAESVWQLLTRSGNPEIVEAVHSYLLNSSMAERDSWWSIWAAENVLLYRDDPDPFLIRWPIERAVEFADPQVALAYTKALSWLTTTSNRYLRARAIKAIACLLQHNISIAADCLSMVAEIDDPYAKEGVALGVYGGCIGAADRDGLAHAAEYVQRTFASDASWPIDLWARHCLSGIIELAVDRGALPAKAAVGARTYQSSWIEDAPSWADVDVWKKEEWAGWGFGRIVYSCEPEYKDGKNNHYGDFGRYVVGSRCYQFLDRSSRLDKTPKPPPFNADLPHRFIIARVCDLGWTAERFEQFDRDIGYHGRSRGIIERMGKKYQWIALSEFLSRAADNYPILGSSDVDDEVRYAVPGDISYGAPTDPTILDHQIDSLDEERSPRWWEAPIPDSCWHSEPNSKAWLQTNDSFPNLGHILQRTADDGSRWLCLSGYLRWSYPHPDIPPVDEPEQRQVWVHVYGYAVKAGLVSKLQQWLKKGGINGHCLPNHPKNYSSLFGERYWSVAVEADDGFLLDDWQYGCPVPLIPLAAEYLNEDDAGLKTAASFWTVGPWLGKVAKLHAEIGYASFVDATGQVAVQNPALRDGGANICFGRQPMLERAAEAAGLAIVWIVMGEKNMVMGHRTSDAEYREYAPWRWLQGVWVLENGIISGTPLTSNPTWDD